MTLNDLIRKASAVAGTLSSGDVDLMILDSITTGANGRRIKDITFNPFTENGQYKVAISFYPPEPERRMPVADRVAIVRDRLGSRGLDPFRDRRRTEMLVATRQCVFLMLRLEGYTQKEIGKATGYDHSTISCGSSHARSLVNLGDSLYRDVWNKVNMIDEGML